MARRKLRIDDATRTKDLSGKTHIVTGANSGLGFEAVKAFARRMRTSS